MTFRTTFKKGDRVRLANDVHTLGYFVRYSGDGSSALVDFDYGEQHSVAFATLRHAPVVVVGARPASVRTTCPEGHPVSAQDCEKYDPTTRQRTNVRVVACGFCDFVEEIKK